MTFFVLLLSNVYYVKVRLNKITKFILRSKINDLSSGIFVMNRKVLLDTLPIASGHGEFMIEFLYNAERKGNIIKEKTLTEVQNIIKDTKNYKKKK